MRADVGGLAHTTPEPYELPAKTKLFVKRSGAGVEPTEPWAARPHWF